MMRTPLLASALTLLLILTGCQSGPGATSAGTSAPATGATLDATSTTPIESSSAVLLVHGLGCPLCAHNVDGQLAAIQGVSDVEVDLGSGNITVQLEGEPRPSPAQLAAAVDRSGFTLVRIFTP